MSLHDFSRAPARIDAALEKALADKRIVGAVLVVARHGEIVYRRAAGKADRESATPLREDAIFRLASIAKPIVTAAAMRLVDDGRLALDAPVTRWLPDFRPALPDGSRRRSPSTNCSPIHPGLATVSWTRLTAPITS